MGHLLHSDPWQSTVAQIGPLWVQLMKTHLFPDSGIEGTDSVRQLLAETTTDSHEGRYCSHQ